MAGKGIIARRFIVRGRVQGVGFRYFAVQAAERTGVSGTVRNLPDGTVEAIAQGTDQQIAEFKAYLESGPAYSSVDEVQELDVMTTGRHNGFRVVY